MKLMMASEFESTGEAEISSFQRLVLLNGRKPFRLAPWPVFMALQAVWLLPLEPDPPELLPPDPPLPDPLLPPELPPLLLEPLPPLDEVIEVDKLPPQLASVSTNASAPVAARPLLQEKFMPLLFQEMVGGLREVRSCPWENRDMYS
jgi:hypothetical protein